VTQDLPVDPTPNATVLLGSRYEIVHVLMRQWTGDCVGCPVTVRLDEDGSAEFDIANPPVAIDPNLNLDVLDLGAAGVEFKSADLPSVEGAGGYHPAFAEWIRPDENAMLNTTLDAALCAGLPDFRVPVAWNEGGALPGASPSIFGRSLDGDTGEEVVFLYDRHLALQENTVDNPVSYRGPHAR